MVAFRYHHLKKIGQVGLGILFLPVLFFSFKKKVKRHSDLKKCLGLVQNVGMFQIPEHNHYLYLVLFWLQFSRIQ